MTNSPSLDHHAVRAAEYSYLSPERGDNTLAPEIKLAVMSRGLGAYGMPGDFSSNSRFIRALFMKNHTRVGVCSEVERFFHIMDSVSVPLGAVLTDEGRAVYTVYTSCMDTRSGIYYFTTYQNRGIRAVKLSEAVGGSDIASFSMESQSGV
jgi:choloylglycine hydrolase